MCDKAQYWCMHENSLPVHDTAWCHALPTELPPCPVFLFEFTYIDGGIVSKHVQTLYYIRLQIQAQYGVMTHSLILGWVTVCWVHSGGRWLGHGMAERTTRGERYCTALALFEARRGQEHSLLGVTSYETFLVAFWSTIYYRLFPYIPLSFSDSQLKCIHTVAGAAGVKSNVVNTLFTPFWKFLAMRHL